MRRRHSRVDDLVWILAAWIAASTACAGSGDGNPPADGGIDLDTGSQTARDGSTNPTDDDASTTDPNALARITIALIGPNPIAPATSATLTATGIRADGTEFDLTNAATWRTSSATTAEVFAGGTLSAIAPGIARVHAERGSISSEPIRIAVGSTQPENVELRGVWVTRWTFSNPQDIQQIVDDVDANNLNAIFFQARGTADAYYRSNLEPWAERLTGTLGEDPGWDPLQEMITRAHAKNIQVHAWLNTFPAWTGTSPPAESTPRHMLLEHPEWVCTDTNNVAMPLAATGYQFFAAGIPEVRDHIADVVEDLASHYAVDGVHMDFIRFPGPQYSHDAVSEAEFAAAQMTEPALVWADFERERITMLVRELRARLDRARPSAALSVASWGIYRNTYGWTPAVSQGFTDYYQDAHRWAREGLVDALCPMIYWRMTTPKGGRTDFATLADDHLAAAREGNRAMFAGMSAEYADTAELEREIEYARSIGAPGFVIFDLSQLRSNNHLARLKMSVLQERARPPAPPFR